jgi:single-strand DNA-binding protein
MSEEHEHAQAAMQARRPDVDRFRRRVRCSRADVQLIGRVGSDPDIHFASEGSGRVWARFSVATDSRYGDDDRPDRHTVIVRDRLAQFVARYLSKGRLVHVIGWLSYRHIEARECAHRVAEIHASDVLILDRPLRTEESPAAHGRDSARGTVA